ncbi:thiamine-binding protein [Nesterenkonia ebinurensis]|uniref:thiamine-binding protein n=1 Tax=Nesterenkonia ebinurensis TaxID=2608252 RepID=UPI00123D4697|nr:thiamine-binding protein [Nesterenkonia ebinurensis]
MLVAFSVAPTTSNEDDDGSVTEAVAQAVKVVKDSGLPYELNSMFTIVEGEWDEVFSVIRRATDVVADTAPRTSLVIKADIRPGYTGQLTEKVRRVEEELGGLV